MITYVCVAWALRKSNAPGSVPRIDHGMAIGGAAAARQQGRCARDVQIETWRPRGPWGKYGNIRENP